MTSKITKQTPIATASNLERKTKIVDKTTSASAAKRQSYTTVCSQNSQNRPIIIFTGGGTGGHVYPNLALVPEFEKRGFCAVYVGGEGNTIERKLARDVGIKYYSVPTIKLVRSMSADGIKNNLKIPSTLKKSVEKASEILEKIKPCCVFSKGGFVSLPVVLAASKMQIPVFAHESDLTMGLANKIAKLKGATILKANPKSKFGGELVGMPLRDNLVYKDKTYAKKTLGINNPFKKPVLLVLGGSSGASAINDAIAKNLKALTEKYFVLHVSGKNKGANVKANDYLQFEYADDVALFYTACDIVLSRAGATSMFEISSIGKRAVFVPLPKGASRGDQIYNAELAKEFGATVLKQDSHFCDNLPRAIETAMQNPSMKPINSDANGKIADLVCAKLRRGEKCTNKKPSPNGLQ